MGYNNTACVFLTEPELNKLINLLGYHVLNFEGLCNDFDESTKLYAKLLREREGMLDARATEPAAETADI